MYDLTGKRVAVTGGAGSIGSALVEHLVAHEQCLSIRVIDSSEQAIHALQQRIKSKNVRFIVADVTDLRRTESSLDGINLIFHCAALKHVPICEYNSSRAVQTNVIGTENVLLAAHACEAERVVVISSDKAAHPTSVLGASKLLAERLASSHAQWIEPAVSCVRFGNVFGSDGSVVPTLLQQIHTDRKVEVTDPNMTRFTMLPGDAVELVVEVAKRGEGKGEVHVLKMGAYRLGDLVEAIISVYRETQDYWGEIDTVVTGRRPGERQDERLVADDEIHTCVDKGSWLVFSPLWVRPEGGGTQDLVGLHSRTTERVEKHRLIQMLRDYVGVQRKIYKKKGA